MALRTFLNIAGDWDLNSEQAMTLLGFDARTRSTPISNGSAIMDLAMVGYSL